MEIQRLLLYYYEMLYKFVLKQSELEEMPGTNQFELCKLSGMISIVCDVIEKLKNLEDILNEALPSKTV